jgi:hypothetical protein
MNWNYGRNGTGYRPRLTSSHRCGTIDFAQRQGEVVVADGEIRLLAQKLQAAVARMQQLSDDYWHTLDPTCGAMDDSAWMGPAGRRFGAAVRSDRGELQRELSKAVRSARDELAGLPQIP